MKRLALLAAAGLVSLGSVAGAQTTLNTLNGTKPLDQMGRAVGDAGDVDGDGFGDVLVAIPFADVNGTDSGQVQVISGRTGQAIYTLNGLAAGDRFGEAVAGVRDINKDGYADFMVGAPMHDKNGSNSGMVRIYSGKNGAVIQTLYGNVLGGWFGASLAPAGDVNKDGWADVIIGSPFGHGIVTSKIGMAFVHSGKDFSLLWAFTSPVGIELLGTSVAGVGDVNKDGYSDLIVGAPEASYTQTEAGRAYVFSGKTGLVLYSWDGTGAGTNFGCSVGGGGGDVNNDGWPDLIVGAQFADNNGGNSGSVWVFSGKNGSQIHRFDGSNKFDELGAAVSSAGDVDGDGYADVIAGARMDDTKAANAGSAKVWSGRTGQVIMAVYGANVDDFFGWDVSCAGDVDGDGLDDVVVGWPMSDVNGQDSGRARVFSRIPVPVTSFCTAKTNSKGCKPVITATGTPSASSSAAFTIKATQVINNKNGILFYGFHGQAAPFQGGTLCVTLPTQRTVGVTSGGSASGTDCSGVLSMNFNAWIKGDPMLTSGNTVYTQWWYRDPAASFGNGLSNGLYFTILP
jgi:hypothetical protein